MAIEIFNIEWTKLQPFEDALTQSASHEGGVYAMYIQTSQGFKLHYIGKSNDFYKRSGTHRNAAYHMMDETQRKKCFISFGLISCFNKSRMTHDIPSDALHDLESFLINTKKPFGNNASTKKGYKGDATIVFNDGNKGSFDKIMTNNEVIINFLKTKL